jgi:UDP-2-acetamido-3-amino-2,3-dideoxy-glucuronate N-acetyltransferase
VIDQTFVHESSYVDEGAILGAGTRVWHFCHIMKGARIGVGCSLGQNVFVASGVIIGNRARIQNNVSFYDGVVLGDDVFCGPSMVFTNVLTPRAHVSRRDEFLPTRVGRGATFGANSTIVCGNEIGEYAFVAAGAVVTRDVRPYALMAGVPATRVGWMCACGVKLPAPNAETGSERESGSVESAETFSHSRVDCGACGDGYLVDAESVTPLRALSAGE